MPEFTLDGCTPEPLMGYLKALGVLRLVAGQADPEARGAWRDGIFVVDSNLEREGVVRFFLDKYIPTPIIAPWAGGSGFFGSDNRAAVDAIAKSKSERLVGFANLIRSVRALLKARGIEEKPTPELKEDLLRQYRRELADEFIDWMDTVVVLQAQGQSFPPLLGTGGNDGRLDFTQNYMQRLVALGFPGSELVAEAQPWLCQSLFGEAVPKLVSAAIGQFDPGRAGGPNATTGMEGGALVNPWDFVFMLEGSLLLAGAAARRMGANQRDKAVFPFTVRPSTVGYASGADAEESESRGEIWLPLWQTPSSLAELQLIFAEGRAEYHGRQSRDGVDFARAVASLGVDRGIVGFTRFGFLKRSGKAYVAAPMGTFPVQERRSADLLHELDRWLESLKRAGAGDETPVRFKTARRAVEGAIYDYCRYSQGENDPAWFSRILAAVGAAERELASGATPPDNRRVRFPLSGLSAGWIKAGDDGSPEYRLARSLASLRGDPHGTGPIRRYLEPVEREKRRWSWSERGGHVVWGSANLAGNLGAVVIRRLMDAEATGEAVLPLGSPFPASLGDVGCFLRQETDDERIQDLLWGLMLVDPDQAESLSPQRSQADFLPRSYALLKLTLLPFPLEWGASPVAIKCEPAILANLRAEKVTAACEIATRRLRASGFTPLASHLADGSRRKIAWSSGFTTPGRLLASLLFPISKAAVNELAKLVLRFPSVESLA